MVNAGLFLWLNQLAQVCVAYWTLQILNSLLNNVDSHAHCCFVPFVKCCQLLLLVLSWRLAC